MKILFINSDGSKSGVPMHIYHLVKGLSKEYKIILVSTKGWLTKKLISEDIEVRLIELNVNLKKFFELRSIYRQYPGAIIHCHGVKAGLVGRLASFGLTNKVIYTEHNWTKDYTLEQTWRKPLQLFMLRILNLFTDKVIAVSKAVQGFYISRNIVQFDKLQLIYNGVEFPSINSKKRRPKDNHNQFLTIGSIGSLVARKNFGFLIEVFDKLVRLFPSRNLKLMIIGEGELKKDLESRIENLGLKDNIDILDSNADKQQFFDAIDIYVQTSTDESFGMAIAEAAGSGVPTIASDVGGIREVIGIENTIELDTEKYLTKIKDIIYNYEEHSKDYLKLAKHIRDKFSIANMLENTAKLYENLN